MRPATVHKSSIALLRQSCKGSPARSIAYVRCPVATSMRAETRSEKTKEKASKLRSLFAEVVFCFEVARGPPEMLRSWPPARLMAYLRCPVRSANRCIFIFHAGTFEHNIVKMQSVCLEDGEGVTQGLLFHFPFQRGPLALAAPPGNSFANQRGWGGQYGRQLD